MKFLEYYFFGVMIIMIGIIICVEISDGKKHNSNFMLDFYIRNHLQPLLRATGSVEEVHALLESDEADYLVCHSCIWRQSLFISFVTSILSIIIIRIFYPMPARITILLFISQTTILLLLISFINTHYYDIKIAFYREIIRHIRDMC